MALARIIPAILFASILVLSLAGAAHAECGTSFDCGYKEICSAGACVYDSLSCKYDYECNAWEFCNSGTYMCQRQEGRCRTDSDCYGYQSCDADNYCTERKTASGETVAQQATGVKIPATAPTVGEAVKKAAEIANWKKNAVVGQVATPAKNAVENAKKTGAQKSAAGEDASLVKKPDAQKAAAAKSAGTAKSADAPKITAGQAENNAAQETAAKNAATAKTAKAQAANARPSTAAKFDIWSTIMGWFARK